MKNIFLAFLVMFFMSGCFKGSGQVEVSATKDDSVIYVDGEKKGMLSSGSTVIKIEEGEHTIKVVKHTKEWDYEGQKKIFVGTDTSSKVKIDMKASVTQYRKEKLKKERLAKIAKEKRETFTDSATGLMWQDSSYQRRKLWRDAVDYCKNTHYAGYDDWRLPKKEELETIIDKDNTPRVIKGFNNIESKCYWSSTPYIDENTAWVAVFYYEGYMAPSGYNNIGTYVTCVRNK